MFHLNITQKFIAYLIVISVIPLIVVGFFSFNTSSAILRDETELFTQEIVDNQLDYLELQQSIIEGVVINVSSVEAIRDILENPPEEDNAFTQISAKTQLGYILNGYINIEGLVSIDIFTTTGQHYTAGDTLVTENIRERIRDDLFEQAIANEEQITWIGVGDNVNGNSDFSKVVTAANIISKLDRETFEQIPLALVLVNFNSETIYNHFSAIDFGEDSYMVVLDGSGRLIYHPNRSRIGTTFDNDVASRMDGSRDSLIMDVDGISYSVSYSRSSTSDWIVASFVPLDTFSNKTEPIQRNTLFILAASFIFVAIAAGLYSRDLVTPIRQLTNRFEQLKPNKVNETSKVSVRGQDEISELSKLYNEFVDSLLQKQVAESEREHLIQELQMASALAQESSRLKSEFLATMSHELRTPLNVILGYVGIILENVDGRVDDDAQVMLQRVRESGNDLLVLINDILDVSRIESGYIGLEPEPVVMNDMITKLSRSMSLFAKDKPIEYKVELADDFPDVIVIDNERLKQILINLLSNAFKFTEEGHVYMLIASEGTQKIIIQVADSGIGIPEDAQGYIFDEFRQVDGSFQRQHGGTGLGLAIVRKLLDLMDGTIEVKSKVGVGSTFIIELPLVLPTDLENAIEDEIGSSN